MKRESISTIQEAMGLILSRKLMDFFDRPEDLSTIQSTDEFRVVMALQDTIEQADNSAGQSANIGFEIISNLWNELLSASTELTKNYYPLLEHVADKLSINAPDHTFLLGSILKHERKIYPKIAPQFKRDFESYTDKANEIIRNFRVNLLSYQAADFIDKFFDESAIFEERKLNFQPTTLSGQTIYLDLNAIVSILSNKTTKRHCLTAAEEKTISFVHSSYVVEDIAVSNVMFVKEQIESLQELTKNQMTAIIDDEIIFATENIYDTLERVNLLRSMTQNFEHHKLIATIKHYHDHPEFRRGETIYNTIAKDPLELFRKDAEHMESPALKLLRFKFQDKPIIQELIESGSIDLSKKINRKEAIEQLLELCDFINFQTEAIKLSNTSKIASSYRDNNHILHASITDYFVSDDEKLRQRAVFVYRTLGIATVVLSSKQLAEKLSENSNLLSKINPDKN